MNTPSNRLLCESARILRDGIRAGVIQCTCPYDRNGQRAHYTNCGWVRAVNDIYIWERSV